jgi:prevent-host-death family protein
LQDTLEVLLIAAILVNMTTFSSRPQVPHATPASHWLLADAKARFSQLVRQVRSEGPQHVSVHGRDTVVVIALEEYQQLRGARSGQALVDAFQACPYPNIELTPPRQAMPVRDVAL